MSGILGKKIGMTCVFADTGESIPVTAIQAGPCIVTDIRTEEKNGYSAIQLGFEEIQERKTTKPYLGQFTKNNLKPCRYLKEFRLSSADLTLKVGDEVLAGMFKVGEYVNVTGVSKGKGFQGVMKRHGFGGGQKTHGQSDRLRAPGSIGQSSYPSRVFKGMKMAGRTGNDQVTVRNLQVVKVDSENNIIMIKGAVPGGKNGMLLIAK